MSNPYMQPGGMPPVTKKPYSKPKCSCGSVLSPRCPFDMCKKCCASKGNPCRLHNPRMEGYTGGMSIKAYDKQQLKTQQQAAALQLSTQALPAAFQSRQQAPRIPAAATHHVSAPPQAPQQPYQSGPPPRPASQPTQVPATKPPALRDLREALSAFQQEVAEVTLWRQACHARCMEHDKWMADSALHRYTSNCALLCEIFDTKSPEQLVKAQVDSCRALNQQLHSFRQSHSPQADQQPQPADSPHSGFTQHGRPPGKAGTRLEPVPVPSVPDQPKAVHTVKEQHDGGGHDPNTAQPIVGQNGPGAGRGGAEGLEGGVPSKANVGNMGGLDGNGERVAAGSPGGSGADVQMMDAESAEVAADGGGANRVDPRAELRPGEGVRRDQADAKEGAVSEATKRVTDSKGVVRAGPDDMRSTPDTAGTSGRGATLPESSGTKAQQGGDNHSPLGELLQGNVGSDEEGVQRGSENVQRAVTLGAGPDRTPGAAKGNRGAGEAGKGAQQGRERCSEPQGAGDTQPGGETASRTVMDGLVGTDFGGEGSDAVAVMEQSLSEEVSAGGKVGNAGFPGSGPSAPGPGHQLEPMERGEERKAEVSADDVDRRETGDVGVGGDDKREDIKSIGGAGVDHLGRQQIGAGRVLGMGSGEQEQEDVIMKDVSTGGPGVKEEDEEGAVSAAKAVQGNYDQEEGVFSAAQGNQVKNDKEEGDVIVAKTNQGKSEEAHEGGVALQDKDNKDGEYTGTHRQRDLSGPAQVAGTHAFVGRDVSGHFAQAATYPVNDSEVEIRTYGLSSGDIRRISDVTSFEMDSVEDVTPVQAELSYGSRPQKRKRTEHKARQEGDAHSDVIELDMEPEDDADDEDDSASFPKMASAQGVEQDGQRTGFRGQHEKDNAEPAHDRERQQADARQGDGAKATKEEEKGGTADDVKDGVDVETAEDKRRRAKAQAKAAALKDMQRRLLEGVFESATERFCKRREVSKEEAAAVHAEIFQPVSL